MDKDLRAAITVIVILVAIGIANYLYPTVKVTEIVPDIRGDHLYGAWVTIKNDFKNRDLFLMMNTKHVVSLGFGERVSLLPYEEKTFYAEFGREARLEVEEFQIRVWIWLEYTELGEHPGDIRIEKTFQVH